MVRARTANLLAALLLVTATGYADEFRSIEITSWGSGFESATAVTNMVNYANSCNLNCVIPEIRLRCDAYYTSSIEPPGTGVDPSPPGFDSLADIIAKAHPLGIKVMPWLVTFRIWTTTAGPGSTTPTHIWYTHGPGNSDPNQDWMMYSDSGAWDYGGIVNLDPGHPSVEDYLITVFMDIVNRYDVDGLNLDYIRYPATNWGYNPKAVERFNWDYGRAGSPSSSDSAWQNWRRDQITNLVKRLYLEIKAVKPWVKLNADVWNSAGTGNASYFQNWDNWMLNHWMDFAHPMSYTSTNSTFEGWCDTYVGNQHGRHVYPLVDASNSVTGNVIPQINAARARGLLGVGLYSYQNIPNRSALQSALVAASGPFPTKVSPPDMPWLSSPTLGMLKGFVKNAGGNGIYPATVTIQSRSTKDTGTGFYGFVDLNTGTYTVDVSAPGYLPTSGEVTITAGVVSNLNFTLAPDVTPPVISNVRTANVQATNVQILWDTNENANSQVEYGQTISYGSQSTLDPAWLTAHTVQLISLSPLTTYHYRVKSRDAGNNLTTSGDYTFTTGSNDIVADIIVDNSDTTKFSLTGSWSTSSSSADKYGTNYHFCSEAASETKSARWTPSIITPGNYNVYCWYPQGGNRATRARYIVYYNGGNVTTFVNQQGGGGQWNLIASNRPFVVGSVNYIKLSNDTDAANGLQVMADAIKLEFADTQAPTVPTGVTATTASTTSIQLNWTASTDNIGVTGYKIWRDGAQAGTRTTTSYTDNGRTPNTSYSYTVSAYDAQNNQSAQSSPAVSRTTLSVPPSISNVTCDRAAGTWYATDGFVFTAVGGFGPGTVSKYIYVWDGNPTCTWEGANDDWNGGTLTMNVAAPGVRYLHLKGVNSEEVANGTLDLGPYQFESEAPSVPANLVAVAASASSVQLNWDASTDNVGVTGYNVYRDGAYLTTVPTNSFLDSSVAANTSYAYEVSAIDGASNESGRSTAAGVVTLSVPPSSSTVTCNRPTGWFTTDGFDFTAVGGFGAGTVTRYQIAWTDTPTYTWTGTELDWNSGTLTETVGTAGVRYLHLKGFNSEDVPNGTLDLGPYGFDDTAPEAPVVTDDGISTTSLTALHASWSGADPESGIQKYEYRIRAEDDTIVQDWTDAGTATAITATGLSLVPGITYYFEVRATNNAGMVSVVGVSDGILVFPFDAAPNGIIDDADFDILSGCAHGPNVPYGTNCAGFDAEPDDDVDQDDFGAFQRCYAPGVPIDPACLN